MTEISDCETDRAFSTAELRGGKLDRKQFLEKPRRPITLVLDNVRQNYNIGAIFRLCDAFLVERLVIGGAPVDIRRRRLAQAARGTQHWVPWEQVEIAASAVMTAKLAGHRIIAVEQTKAGLPPESLATAFPVCLVLGSEKAGVSQEIIEAADAVATIPMLGMANSINVATAAAILLFRLSVLFERGSPMLVGDELGPQK